MVWQNLETTNLRHQSTDRIRASEFPHLPTPQTKVMPENIIRWIRSVSN